MVVNVICIKMPTILCVCLHDEEYLIFILLIMVTMTKFKFRLKLNIENVGDKNFLKVKIINNDNPHYYIDQRRKKNLSLNFINHWAYLLLDV